jgi:CRP-like cAMP-binding protein
VLPVVVALTWRQVRAVDAAAPAPTRALELLQRVPFLAGLPPVALEALALHTAFVDVPAGRRVFEQGDPGDRFYAIADGEASVESDGRHVADLGPGEEFGEIALLRDVPRTATVTARTDLTLLALERDDFLAAVTGHAATAEAVSALVETRLSRTIAGLRS